MRSRIAAVLFLAMAVSGCSPTNFINDMFNSSKEEPPAPLPDLQAEITLEEQWSASIGEGQGEIYNLLVPAVYGNQIYAADDKGIVVSLDRFTGKTVWQVKLKEPVSGAVSAGYGLVLLGTLKGDVIALDASDGSEKWRSQVHGEVLAPPAINGDMVLVQTIDDRLIALEIGSGSQRWAYENPPALLTLRGTGAPMLTNQLAIAGLSTGRIVALDTQRGLPIWEQRVAIPQGRSELERVVDIDGGLLLSGGTLYAVTYQGNVAAFELQSGRLLWQRDASSYVGVAQGYGSVYLSLANGTVQGIDERSTTVLWSNDSLARRQLSAPASFSSYIAVGDLEGYLHLLSQIDGRFVGRVKIDSSGVRARPIVEGDWLYAFGNDGDLVALTLGHDD